MPLTRQFRLRLLGPLLASSPRCCGAVCSSHTTAPLGGGLSHWKLETVPMIAPRKPVRRQASPPEWHRQFLAMLPVIRNYADSAFRHLDPEGREDAVHEVVANVVVAFARLVKLGKSHRS